MNEIKLPASKIMDIQSTVSCQIETVGTSSSVFDEDFFVMLLSRLSEPDAKLFATTNPDSPNHWLMTNYIQRANEENLDSSVIFGEDPKFIFSLTFSSKNKSLDCEVWIQPIEYSFEIVSAITLNGRQVSQNYITLSQAELIEYSNDEMEIREDDFEEDEDDDIIVLSEEEYDKLKKELNAVTMVDDVAIDESTGEPEVEIEFFDGDEDELDDITDNY